MQFVAQNVNVVNRVTVNVLTQRNPKCIKLKCGIDYFNNLFCTSEYTLIKQSNFIAQIFHMSIILSIIGEIYEHCSIA